MIRLNECTEIRRDACYRYEEIIRLLQAGSKSNTFPFQLIDIRHKADECEYAHCARSYNQIANVVFNGLLSHTNCLIVLV